MFKQQEEQVMAAKKKSRKPANKTKVVVSSALETARTRAAQLKKSIKAVRAEAETRLARIRAAAGCRQRVSLATRTGREAQACC
jgi:hypothetical protein